LNRTGTAAAEIEMNLGSRAAVTTVHQRNSGAPSGGRGVPETNTEGAFQMNPTDPPTDTELWAVLRVDEFEFRLVKPWNIDTLTAALRNAAARGTQVEVRAYTELNAEITVLVNPARARVVHVAKKNVIVVRNGMPDVSLTGLGGLRNVSAG
jgi:hypothetical protein